MSQLQQLRIICHCKILQRWEECVTARLSCARMKPIAAIFSLICIFGAATLLLYLVLIEVSSSLHSKNGNRLALHSFYVSGFQGSDHTLVHKYLCAWDFLLQVLIEINL